MRPVDKLVLGTAQLGLAYGVANSSGQPDLGRVAEILAVAKASGIRMLDTAAAYGISEETLGCCGVGDWSVMTKVPSLSALPSDQVEHAVRKSVLDSLGRLRLSKLHAVLAHDSRDLTGARGAGMLAALQTLKSEGLVERVGASVYEPVELDHVEVAGIDIVQAPFNILDRRIIASGKAAALNAWGGALHVRSIFLQGLLLMSPDLRPSYFQRWSPHLARLDAYAVKSGLDPLALCLGFVTQQPLVARCVVGAETPMQVEQIAAACTAGQNVALNLDDLGTTDPDLIDPRHWKVLS